MSDVSETKATPDNGTWSEPDACTHECSEESGCITKELHCPHIHDEECGYGKIANSMRRSVDVTAYPVVDRTGIQSASVYANGAALIITDIITDEGKSGTAIYIDADRDGEIDSNENTLAHSGVEGAFSDNGDLSSWIIYGGRYDGYKKTTGDGQITMLGGSVYAIYGGGYSSGQDSVEVDGDTVIRVTGGTVQYIYGGGKARGADAVSNVNGTATIEVSDCEIGCIYGGGDVKQGSEGNVGQAEVGETNIIITGETSVGTIYGGGVNDSGAQDKYVTVGDSFKGEIVINGEDANNGVDSFEISPDLTDGADVGIRLPADYPSGEIVATGVAEEDKNYIRLTGSNDEMSVKLEGSDLKVIRAEHVAIPEITGDLDTAQVEYALGSSAPAFTVTANVEDGGTLSYEWYRNDTNDTVTPTKVGTNSNSYTPPTDTVGTVYYYCVITNTKHGDSGTETSTVTSKIACVRIYENTGSGSGNSGSSSSGGSAVSTSSALSAGQLPPATVEVHAEAKSDNTGHASVLLSTDALGEAIKTARDTARKNGAEGNGIAVNIHVTSGGENVSGITVNLPIALQEKVINENVQNLTLVVDRPDVSIGMDLACVTEINRQAKADVQINARRITDLSKLTAETRKAVGDRPVFDFSMVGGGRTITGFGSGRVTVKLPYQLKAGERAGNVQTAYIDEQGRGQILAASDYEEETGMILFQPPHFSLYAVTYQAAPAFTDTVNDWAVADIDFAVSRGLLEGTSGTSFNPDGILTRGMFVTALGRLAGVDTAAYQNGSFDDVKADDIRAPYSNWAADKNILNGITATTFAPEQGISREHMAAALAAYEKAVGSRSFNIYKESTYADGSDISTWAVPAVKQMQMAGVMMAKNANRFEPQQTVSRREAAVILHRLVARTMDITTADGWTQNDSGQWMYYVNGSPVKSQTREIDGTPYVFDNYGVTPR